MVTPLPMRIDITRYRVEVGARVGLLVIRLGLHGVGERHIFARDIIIVDGVVHNVTPGRRGVVTHVDIGREPAGDVIVQRLADADARHREFVVSALLHLGHGRAPRAPGVGLAVECGHGQTGLRQRRGQGRRDVGGRHLLLSAVADTRIEFHTFTKLIGVVQTEVVATVVVVTVLQC